MNQSVMRMSLSFEPCKRNIGQVNIAMANHHIFIAEYFRLSSQPAILNFIAMSDYRRVIANVKAPVDCHKTGQRFQLLIGNIFI